MKIQTILIAGAIALGSSCGFADPLRPISGGVLPPAEINGIVRSMGLIPTAPLVRERLTYAVLATNPRGKPVRVIVDARSGNVLSVRGVVAASLPGGHPAPPRPSGLIVRTRPPALAPEKQEQNPAATPASPNAWTVTIDPSAAKAAADPKPTVSTPIAPSFPPVQSLE